MTALRSPSLHAFHDIQVESRRKLWRDLAILPTQTSRTGNRLVPESMGTRLEDLEQRQAGTRTATVEMRDKLAALATLNIAQLSSEDLRQLISQGVALDLLVPRALSILEQTPLIRADLFAGDLLEAVKTVPFEFWDQRPDERLAWNRLRSQHDADEH